MGIAMSVSDDRLPPERRSNLERTPSLEPPDHGLRTANPGRRGKIPAIMQGLVHDIRYSARLLRRHPRHALLTVAALALGIGAATLLFSVAYTVLLEPLPWPNAGRVVVLTESRGGRAPRFGTFTNEAFLAWRDQPAAMPAIRSASARPPPRQACSLCSARGR